MKKTFLLFLTIFLAFPLIVYSIKTFVIQETEKISLVPQVSDPDADKLAFYYTPPLDENGEWQTDYGDAGRYSATITVSDGVSNTSEDVLIIVNKKEEAPAISNYKPKQDTLNIDEGMSINFSVTAQDLNSDQLTYEWLLDGKKASSSSEFEYRTRYGDYGFHSVVVIVSDGIHAARRAWGVNVEKLDIQGLLDDIPDVTVNENEIASIKLPDFTAFKLTYTIAEPLGSENEWQTNYESAGTYYIKVRAEGNGFRGEKDVKITVNDMDRPPVFEPIPNLVMNENEEVRIPLKASDPDWDNVYFSANSMPNGSTMDGNIFVWKPGYDAVTRDGFIENLINKFRVPSKNYYVQLVASSNDKQVVQNIVITVKNVNRAPALDDIKDITVKEGDTLAIFPDANDPDGDKVSISYSGYTKTIPYQTKYGDAGNHTVKVTASDGSLETSKYAHVKILPSNSPPIFNKMKDIKANEGDEVGLLLSVYDPNKDLLYLSMDNPPNISKLEANAFIWNVSYDLASKGETKNVDLVFVASDGKSEAREIVKAQIKDKNRKPRIINSSQNVIARVNKPVLLFVNAVDDDKDFISYTWKFTVLESYTTGPNHQRIFTTRGTKTIDVIVSDGTDETEHTITVNVV